MARLPVIVGFGGYSAAGRSAGHHAYRRMVLETLPQAERRETLAGLACMMGLVTFREGSYRDGNDSPLSPAEIESRYREVLEAGSLIRRIDPSYFDVDATPWQKSASLTPSGESHQFVLHERDLPEPVPDHWQLTPLGDRRVQVELVSGLDVKWASFRDMPVKSAGQLPAGFNPADLYNARFHPRALQLAVISASDAVRSVGIPWEQVVAAVQPDEVGVYASNVMSQMDEEGFGGLLQARLKGGRVTTKQCPLGLNSMVADFVNA